MSPRRRRLFILNDPHALRISPELAVEIGFNESIVLLQLEFLISISDHVHEGRVWTYQSVRDLQQHHFPWWSIATISRTIKQLQVQELILIGNFNRAGFDKTQWFALNEVGLKRLRAVRLGDETGVFQNETPMAQGETRTFQTVTPTMQNGTAIPETTTKTTAEKDSPLTLQQLEEHEQRWQEHRRRMTKMSSLDRRRG